MTHLEHAIRAFPGAPLKNTLAEFGLYFQTIILIWYMSQKKEANMLLEAFLPLILLHWVIFIDPFLNIYCQYYTGSCCSICFVCIVVVVGVGLNPPASSELVTATWSAMPSLKLVTNLICTLLASGAYWRVQNVLIVCRRVSLKDHNQAQYRSFQLETGGEERQNPEQMRITSAVIRLRKLKH